MQGRTVLLGHKEETHIDRGGGWPDVSSVKGIMNIPSTNMQSLHIQPQAGFVVRGRQRSWATAKVRREASSSWGHRRVHRRRSLPALRRPREAGRVRGAQAGSSSGAGRVCRWRHGGT